MKDIVIILSVFVSGILFSGCSGGIVYSGSGYYNDGFSYYYNYPAYPYYYRPPVYYYPNDWARGRDYYYHHRRH